MCACVRAYEKERSVCVRVVCGLNVNACKDSEKVCVQVE